MTSLSFVLFLGALSAVLLIWGCRVLPHERWQILASIPVRKIENGRWHAINITYYGVLTALAYCVAVAMLILLAGAAGIPPLAILSLAIVVLSVAVPASRWVAMLVERKACTFTMGGALFVAVLGLPAEVWAVNAMLGSLLDFHLSFLPVAAAVATAYAFGEGIGRLACISFGCCYGKPIAVLPSFWRPLLRPVSFRFVGALKKIAYASGLEGQPVIPIQGLTAIVHVATGLVATYLFLEGQFALALAIAMILTQLWRVMSEFWRADYRGQGQFSAYQAMAVMTAILVCLFAWSSPVPTGDHVDLARGLDYLWSPVTLVFLQCLWVAIFLYTGRSMVTESSVELRLCRHKL